MSPGGTKGDDERLWLSIQYQYAVVVLEDGKMVDAEQCSTPERSPERGRGGSTRGDVDVFKKSNNDLSFTPLTSTVTGACGIKFALPELRDLVVNAIIACNPNVGIGGSVV